MFVWCLCEQGKGASRQALLKYLMSNFSLGHDEKAVNSHLRVALKSGIEKGLLVQSTGKGLTGSVKLSKGAVKKATKVTAVKKPKATAAAKKPKATAAKRPTTKKAVMPKKVSLSASSKAKKPLSRSSLTKATKAKVSAKPKAAPKKTAAKPKATKAKVVAKPKVTKAAAGKVKKSAGKK